MSMKLTDHPPMSRTDKLCAIAILALWFGAGLVNWAMDAAWCRAAEVDKLQEQPTAVVQVRDIPLDCTPLVEAVEAAQDARYDEDIPLDRECQKALREACEVNGVPMCLALGVMEVESGFDPMPTTGVSVGLMQLNKTYFPTDLTPAENIRAGVEYLGELLERYGDEQAALVAYNQGTYNGTVTDYARKVLNASEKWGCG